MKIEQLIPRPIQKVQFKLGAFKYIPKETGCYILATFENDILYIGLSVNLFDRFQQHLANPEKISPTIEGKAIWFYFSIYDSLNLPMLERTWLNQFVALHGKLPSLNKISSPIS
jgi:hypothetical protein